MSREVVYICTSCFNQVKEKSLQSGVEASKNWVPWCRLCGGKVNAFEVDTDDKANQIRQIKDQLEKDLGKS